MDFWPAYHISCPMGDPTRTPLNPIPRPSCDGLPANHDDVRKDVGPAPLALVANGAQRVGPREFRMLGGGGHLATPLAPM